MVKQIALLNTATEYQHIKQASLVYCNPREKKNCKCGNSARKKKNQNSWAGSTLNANVILIYFASISTTGTVFMPYIHAQCLNTQVVRSANRRIHSNLNCKTEPNLLAKGRR